MTVTSGHRCRFTRRALCLTALALVSSTAVGGIPATAVGGTPATVVEAEIERHAAAAGAIVGVSAMHLASGRQVRVNAERRFPLASTYKIPMAAYALHLVASGQLDPTTLVEVHPDDRVISSSITRLFPHPGIHLSLYNLMEAMLIQSDNTATDVLLRTVGGGRAVTRWLEEQGIHDLRVDRSTAQLIRDYMDVPAGPGAMATQFESLDFQGFTEADWQARYQALLRDPRDQGTPDAMVRLLAALWQNELLDGELSDTLRGMLRRCLTGSQRLSGRMPAQQLPLAHKTGTLGGTVNDVGVVELPDDGGAVVMAVFTQGASTLDVEAGERLIADVARSVYDYFLFAGTDAPTSGD